MHDVHSAAAAQLSRKFSHNHSTAQTHNASSNDLSCVSSQSEATTLSTVFQFQMIAILDGYKDQVCKLPVDQFHLLQGGNKREIAIAICSP